MNKPWSVQIELCEGCTRLCKQCGCWSLGKDFVKRRNLMSIDLADTISKELGHWLVKGKRIEFSLQGEPLLNKNAPEIIRLFRQNYPTSQLQLTTNGDPLRNNENFIDRLFDAGLNYLLVDCYEKPWLMQESVQFESFNVYQYRGNTDHKIVLMDNYSEKAWKNRRRFLNNQAGYIRPDFARELGISMPSEPLKKRCSNPFHELVIKYDGLVPLCCMAWLREPVMGRFPDQSLESIWNSDTFNLHRQLLYNKNRCFSPCNKCNYSGFKTGLLKNPNFPIPAELESHEPQQVQFKF